MQSLILADFEVNNGPTQKPKFTPHHNLSKRVLIVNVENNCSTSNVPDPLFLGFHLYKQCFLFILFCISFPCPNNYLNFRLILLFFFSIFVKNRQEVGVLVRILNSTTRILLINFFFVFIFLYFEC